MLHGIIFVLSTGLPWEYLPPEMVCGLGVTLAATGRVARGRVWRRLHQALLNHLSEADLID